VLVGDDPVSVTYVRMKQRSSAVAGIDSRLVELAASDPPRTSSPQSEIHPTTTPG
jgi:5,10-methylene-tetrahydrofolate dehydrogenase/methenyl tetrahydrofolate cyclohydrolase